MKKIVSIVAATLLIGSCGIAAENTVQAPDEEKLQGILADFEMYAQGAMQDWRIPGMAIAIVRNDKVIYAKGFGVKTAGGNEPVDTHTVFQIGSASKAFTAALTAMTVDEKKVGWKDRVIDHVQEFRMYDPWVTREFMIEDLLAQHSGMPPYAGDFQSIAGFDRDHIMHSLRYIKPVSSFRSEFAYVNNLFLVAGKVIERYTGKSWEKNIDERIFKPLGMNESSTDAKSLIGSENAATPHDIQNQEVTPIPKDLEWPYVYGPAGGINSNVLDMAQWLRLQINDGIVDGTRLVSEENTNFVHSPKTITQPPSEAATKAGKYYCESWVYEDMRPYPMVWHNGGTTGFHSMVAFWPEPKIGMVILTNLAQNKLAEALPKHFNDLYFDNPDRDRSKEELDTFKKNAEEAKAKAPKKPASPQPALPLENYAGTYRNDVYEDAAVAQKEDSLVITIGPAKFQFFLTHWDRDTFYYSLITFGDGSEGFASFSQDPEGKVNRMTISMLNDDGCGVFQRVK